MGLDIGPKTIDLFRTEVLNAGTVIWNGPMGVFEFDAFATGTFAVANALADMTDKGGISIVGGGDSVAAIQASGLANKISHISTGGGASLELLEGKTLPGVDCLDDEK
jgi:phosphoglycerate kinase